MIDWENRKFTFHRYQTMAWRSNKRVIAFISGIQGGKSLFGAHWMRKKIQTSKDGGVSFLVCVPDYPNLYQGALIPWKRVNGDLGVYNEQKNIFRLWDGRTVYFRSGEKPDSVESIPNCAAIWCDEAGKFRREFWLNIYARSAKMGAQILLTTTPYGRNWLWTDIVQKAQRGQDPDIDLISFESSANPSFPKEQIEDARRKLSAIEFARKFQGQFVRREGLVYPDFNPDTMCYEPTTIQGARYFGGLDWGFSAPFGLTIRAVDENGTHWIVSEFLRSGLTPEEKIGVVRGKMSQFPVEMFYADSEAPDMIESFNRAGIPTLGVKKNRDSVMHGIELHTQLIRSGKYRVFRTLKNLLEEYETYAYEESDDEDQREARPIPVNNHLMDCERYCTANTFSISARRVRPKDSESMKQLTLLEEISQIKKGKPSQQIDWVNL